jgi:uncharacterized protein GlcG (DUF336 family)
MQHQWSGKLFYGPTRVPATTGSKAAMAPANPAGILIQGGVPILVRGECVGAIGVSGVASHEDEQIAQAGVSALA